MTQFLAISGSLRAASSNTALLRATALLATLPTTVPLYADLGRLPHFNPDLEDDLPALVRELHAEVEVADALVISCPEYARGIPGSFKNLLDWLVGSRTFPGKPVALFSASSRALEADAALRLVLTTMSAQIVGEACIVLPLLGKGMDVGGIAADRDCVAEIRRALAALQAFVDARSVS